nr:MAG TPA: hypothetical protein [Caudoviricetes sp.]
MATSLRNVIENFKISMDEIDNHLNAQDEYINDLARKAKQVSSALKLLKIAVRSNVDKIDGYYYTDPLTKDAFLKDDDVSRLYDSVAAEGLYSIIILDDESPLFLQEISVMISHEFDKHDANNSTRLISFLVDGKPINYVSSKVIWYKNKTFSPIDDTIMMFIEDTKKKAKAIEDIRTATSIENHPIGKEEKK